MRRGEVRMVDLEPVRGAEANKRRPAIVVSDDEANRAAAQIGRGVLTVVPVTSNVERVYPFQTMIPSGEAGLAHDSKAQAEQVRSIDAQRVGALLGSLPAHLMASLDDALRLHLSL
jgi:mRNA interferase MazF